MNCNEIKNQISESENLAIFEQTPEAAVHLKSCAGCRAALTYEEKLRQGFAGIASEAAPPDLVIKIMTIQSEQLSAVGSSEETTRQNWLSQLLRSLHGFPFKVAFAAGLAGFFAAVLLLRQPQVAPVNQPAVITQSKAIPGPANEEVFKMSTVEETQTPAEPANDKIIIDESLSDKERIPGAITFALDSSADAFVVDNADGVVMLADQPAASEAAMQLAMAPAIESEAVSSRPSSTARFAAAPPITTRHSRLAASQVISENSESKSEEATTQQKNPLAEELRDLIENNAIDQAEGFISLDEFVMRGYLPAEHLHRLRPPVGNGWYLQKTGSQIHIFLKKLSAQ